MISLRFKGNHFKISGFFRCIHYRNTFFSHFYAKRFRSLFTYFAKIVSVVIFSPQTLMILMLFEILVVSEIGFQNINTYIIHTENQIIVIEEQ